MKLNEILEKYPQTNNEWGLHTYNFGNSTSLGKRISWMYNELILNCGLDTIPGDVLSSINSFDNITEYFVRRTLNVKDFRGDDVYDKLAPSNADPWGREFIVYVGNVLHPQYAHIKNRDGYQKSFVSVYYTNIVSNYSGIHINNDNVPLMILYVTSVNGLNINCLDVIKNTV